MKTYEGLAVFDVGEVAGVTCRDRAWQKCLLVDDECDELECSKCLYCHQDNLDAFRRWETGQPDRTKEATQ